VYQELMVMLSQPRQYEYVEKLVPYETTSVTASPSGAGGHGGLGGGLGGGGGLWRRCDLMSASARF
jgi:hypothetical protein